MCFSAHSRRTRDIIRTSGLLFRFFLEWDQNVCYGSPLWLSLIFQRDPNPDTKFKQNLLVQRYISDKIRRITVSSFYMKLLEVKQANKRLVKHNLLGGGNSDLLASFRIEVCGNTQYSHSLPSFKKFRKFTSHTVILLVYFFQRIYTVYNLHRDTGKWHLHITDIIFLQYCWWKAAKKHN